MVNKMAEQETYIRLGKDGMPIRIKQAFVVPPFERKPMQQPESYLEKKIKTESGKSIKIALVTLAVLSLLLACGIAAYFLHRYMLDGSHG